MYTGSNSAQKAPLLPEIVNEVIDIPPMDFVSSNAKVVWEGKIEDKIITYYKEKRDGGNDDIVVLVRDRLPESFKRIEYLDKDGNKDLDALIMKIYEGGKGWRDVTITREHKYGLNYVNQEYNLLLEEIKEARK